MKRYYSLYQDKEKNVADIYIYGDITSWPWTESDVSSYILSKQLSELDDSVKDINVYISSYGGEVAEGLAIYNALKRHSAKVTTYADGFACSIASVIFAAGDERVMSDTSLLMIHNAWTTTSGNAEDLLKQAENLEKITQASVNAYMEIVNVEEEELKGLMDNETWLNGQEALDIGFATELTTAKEKEVATQSVRKDVAVKLAKQEMDSENMDLESELQAINDKLDDILDAVEEPEPETEEDNEEDVETPADEPVITENKPLNMMKNLFN